mgnify:CR=1 FL=1
MNEDGKHRSSTEDRPDSPAKAADAAVRRALLEGRRHIQHFLLRRLGDADAAEEVLQVFMLRAIDRSGQLRDVRAVRGWLSQILASSIADYGRKVGRQRQREVVMAPTDLDNIQDGFDEELDEAKAALHMLHTIHTGTIDTKTGRIVILEKTRRTPKVYPRRDGEPKRSPLGVKKS